MADDPVVEELIRRTRTDRGLPRKVTDPIVIAKFAEILAAAPAPTGKEQAS